MLKRKLLIPPNLKNLEKQKILSTPIFKRIGLTRKEYLDENIIKRQEKEFVRKFTKRGEKIVWIKRDSKVDIKTGIYYPTNDFIWCKDEWELKSRCGKTVRDKTVIKRINESVDKEKRRICLDLGNNIPTERLLEKLSSYNISRSQNQKKRYVKNIIIYDKEGLWEIILK